MKAIRTKEVNENEPHRNNRETVLPERLKNPFHLLMNILVF